MDKVDHYTNFSLEMSIDEDNKVDCKTSLKTPYVINNNHKYCVHTTGKNPEEVLTDSFNSIFDALLNDVNQEIKKKTEEDKAKKNLVEEDHKYSNKINYSPKEENPDFVAPKENNDAPSEIDQDQLINLLQEELNNAYLEKERAEKRAAKMEGERDALQYKLRQHQRQHEGAKKNTVSNTPIEDFMKEFNKFF